MSTEAPSRTGKQQFCPSCGTETESVMMYCPECGTELSSATEGKESYLDKKAWIIISIVSSIVALGFIPIVFGLAGVFSGYQVFKTNETQGLMLMIFGGVCLVIGMLIGMFVWTS